jgi:arylsulfatase A-like enzyme
MSLYGHPHRTTPNLEALAREAVVFDAFFNAGGGTLKSHASLFTSLYPEVHGVNPKRALADDFRTLAEVLRARGYATAAFVDVAWLGRKYGFDQGFDHYDEQGGRLERILPEAIGWLGERARARAEGRAEPFFLFLHTFDVHSGFKRLPYDAPEDFNEVFTRGYQGEFDGCRKRRCASALLKHVNAQIDAGQIALEDVFTNAELEYIAGLYDGGVLYVDRELGKLVQTLRQTGLYDSTLLVVLSDHGEELGEHGRMLHGNPYEEFVRIPLLMKFPGSRHAGIRVSGLGSMVDVMPTLLDEFGLTPQPGMQGRSLLPLIESGLPVRSHVYSHDGSVRDERWKLIASRRELFDLERDPAERRNLYHLHPEIVSRLAAERDEGDRHDSVARERLPRAAGPTLEPDLTPEERSRLRSLGYLDDPE